MEFAYVSNVTSSNEIWVRPYTSDGEPVRVSPNGGTEPVWSRNGGELFHLQGNKMMAVSVQTGAEFVFEAPTELFDESYRHNTGPSYDVAPDGGFILIQETNSGRQKVTASIIVVLNWFEYLKGRVPLQTENMP